MLRPRAAHCIMLMNRLVEQPLPQMPIRFMESSPPDLGAISQTLNERGPRKGQGSLFSFGTAGTASRHFDCHADYSICISTNHYSNNVSDGPATTCGPSRGQRTWPLRWLSGKQMDAFQEVASVLSNSLDVAQASIKDEPRVVIGRPPSKCDEMYMLDMLEST